MTLATSAMSTFIQKGNREDLTDDIYRIDPTDTPLVSGVDKIKAKATLHEWQTQALGSASATVQLEGDESITGGALTVTTRLTNNVQIQRRVAAVSATAQAVEHAGRDDEFAYQMMLKGLELRRDIELAVFGTNLAKSAGSSTAARQTATILSWITTNTSKGGSGGDPAAADGTGTRTDGTQRAFTEDQLKTVLNAAWGNGGKPDSIFTGAFNKQVFSTFVGRSSPIEQAATKKITAAVTAYESDFGTLKVIADRFQRSRDVLVLQMDMWALAYLRNMQEVPLAKTGDRDLAMLVAEYGLEARNEKSSAIVADLTTS